MKTGFFTFKEFSAHGKIENGRIYLFCGFASPIAVYRPAIRRFRKNGYSVVAFSFKTKSIIGLTVQSLPKIIDGVCSAVAQLEETRKGGPNAIVIGNSMGCVFAWHAAKRIRTINKVVANSAYALISKHVFESPIGRHWRGPLQKDDIDEETFHKLIRASEPITDFHLLKGKRVLLFMNRDDKVIDISHAALFKDALEANHINYTYVENKKLRHGTAILKNLQSKTILDFIKS